MMRIMQNKGWRKSEPLDNTMKAAKPALFSDAVDLLLDNKVFTQKEFVDELSEMGLAMNPSELEVLLNLSKGTLSVQNTESVKMVMLKPKE